MSAPVAAQQNGPLLRDIHLPPQPSWWPPAPGWWVLAVLVIACAGIGIWWWRRRSQRRVAERRVLAEVDQVLALAREQPQALAAGLHQLLRRGALRIDPLAGQLHGNDWRQTLARMPVDAATLEQLHAVEIAMFRPGALLDADAAANATRRWLALAWRQGLAARTRGQSKAVEVQS